MRLIQKFLPLSILAFVSCHENNSKDKIIEEQQRQIDSLQRSTIPQPTYDTVKVATPVIEEKANREKHFPEGMFETYPQIIKFLFAYGSTIEEVQSILGNPEYKDSKTERKPNTGIYNTLETYYYGKMNISFKNGVVDGIDNYEKNEHCLYYYGISTGDLLVSDNPIERKWAIHLLENQRHAEYPYGL